VEEEEAKNGLLVLGVRAEEAERESQDVWAIPGFSAAELQ